MEGENELYLLSDISNVLSMSNGWWGGKIGNMVEYILHQFTGSEVVTRSTAWVKSLGTRFSITRSSPSSSSRRLDTCPTSGILARKSQYTRVWQWNSYIVTSLATSRTVIPHSAKFPIVFWLLIFEHQILRMILQILLPNELLCLLKIRHPVTRCLDSQCWSLLNSRSRRPRK